MDLTCPQRLYHFLWLSDQPLDRLDRLRLAQGMPLARVCRKLEIHEQTYYRWRKEYGGLRVDQAKRLKELEQENSRLKKMVAEQALDLSILKEVSSGNF